MMRTTVMIMMRIIVHASNDNSNDNHNMENDDDQDNDNNGKDNNICPIWNEKDAPVPREGDNWIQCDQRSEWDHIRIDPDMMSWKYKGGGRRSVMTCIGGGSARWFWPYREFPL